MKMKSLFALAIISAAVPSFAFAQNASPTFLEKNSVGVAIVVFLYILPSWFAWSRKHGSKGSIIAVNILLGWTAVGWIWALIWSLGSKGQTVVVVNTPPAMASQTVPVAVPVGHKTVADRIGELKAMLDAGTINQNEFDMLKAEALKALA
jgi:hypothetical protein